MARGRFGLHLPDIAVANELVAHRHAGLGRLTLWKKAYLRFARIPVKAGADDLDIQIRQTKISTRLHVPQDGGPDGFVVVDIRLPATRH